MKSVWLGLGGNLGDVRSTLAHALQQLNNHLEVTVESVSSVYKTPPWGVEDQPRFLNCCAMVATTLSPEALLEVCQNVERIGKRERVQRWGPRTIDVDILVFEGVEQADSHLTIPHPRMLDRAFVLIPLAEIAPRLVLQGETCVQWAKRTNEEGIEKINSEKNWWRNSNL